MNKRPILQVSNLSKTYQCRSETQKNDLLKKSANNISNNTIVALNNISFDLYPGESLGIIGDNGAGKSTLLKILGGIVRPSSGTVNYQGKISSILDIGTGFHPDLSGRENIYLNGQIIGYKKYEIKNKIETIIDFSGINHFIDEPIKTYSNGMYLRLAFSIIIHLEADILILDEVISVGDLNFQNKCLEHLLALKSSGKSLIIASHNLRQISDLCDNLMIINNGTLIDKNDKMTILKRYKSNTQLNFKKLKKDTQNPISIHSTKGTSHKINDNVISITKVSMKNEQNLTKSTFNIGELISLNLKFNNNYEQKIEIAIVIVDLFNNTLFGTDLNKEELRGRIKSGENKIKWEFPTSILADGRYYPNIFIFSARNYSLISRITEIIHFDLITESKNIQHNKSSLKNESPIRIKTKLYINE
tara:strand:- start:1122 stop:2375 length:1254 start_codon:yes stop_codon:yes gene_type:complete